MSITAIFGDCAHAILDAATKTDAINNLLLKILMLLG
jgi:hypothetical protein